MTCGFAIIIAALAAMFAGEAAPVDFARDVAPLLESHCIRCHQPSNRKGEISLATREDLAANEFVVAGKPDESHLVELVTPAADGGRPGMPKTGDPLTTEELALLRRWIAEGADWPKEVVVRDRSRADHDWWSLVPLAKVEPPVVNDAPAAWMDNPIDRFVYAKLKEQGLAPNPPADKLSLIRRLTFDLTGLPPAPVEVESFLADNSLDAYERLVERLLASPHYGEQWGRHWLDVVRFGESNGYERNVLINSIWPFRDYVIRSFNEDKPFDRLVLEHLAGDVLGPGNPAVEAGTAFLVCGPYDDVGNSDAAQAAVIRADKLDEIIRATSEAFLGLTVGCARCHDHKFDPITQSDYYGLHATFAGVNHGERVVARPKDIAEREAKLRPLQERREQLVQQAAELEEAVVQRGEARASEFEQAWTRPPVERSGVAEEFTPIEARYVRLVVLARDDVPSINTEYQLDEFEVWTAEPGARNVALAVNGGQATGASRAAEDFADAYIPALTIDGRHGAKWIATGESLTIELAAIERVARVVFSNDGAREQGADRYTTPFVGEYRIEVSLDGEQWVEVANGHDRQPASTAHRRRRLIKAVETDDERARRAELSDVTARVEGEMAALPLPPSWWLGQFQSAPGPFQVFLGGDPARPGDAVQPHALSTLAQNELTYVLEVASPEGERRLKLAQWIVAPANPLTPRVLANRLWHYHFGRGIVDTPSDFGYMGGRPTHPELLDWLARQVHENGWRLKPLHRLIVLSQTYRQSADLCAEAAKIDADARHLWRFLPRRLSGEELRDSMLAVSGALDERMGGPGFRLYHYMQDNVATYVPLDAPGPETYRRAVYHQNARAARVDVLSDFDCPDPAFAAPRRAATTTPLQALTLLNHRFTFDMAEALAERVTREAGPTPEDCARHAYALAFGRPPDDEETATAVQFIASHGLPAFCRALFNANEFVYLN